MRADRQPETPLAISSHPRAGSRLPRIAGPAVLVTLLLAAAALPALGEAPGGLTPHDVLRLRTVEEAAISPDGAAIAYTLEVQRRPGRDEDGPAWRELHVIDTASGVSEPFITGEVDIRGLDWTPDSRRITFTAQRGDDPHKAVWAIPLGGGEARRLAALPEIGVSRYSLCADGRHLALLGTEPAGEEEQARHEQGFHQEIYEEDWRPGRVWVTRLGENGDTAAEPGAPLAVDGHVTRAAWSPDCDRLALHVAPSALIDEVLMLTRVWIVDAGSGEVQGKIDNPGKIGEVIWSPDGATLAMIAAADLHDPREGRLSVAPATGGVPRDLLPGLEAHVLDLAFDGDRLVYLVHQGVDAYVATVELTGQGAPEPTRLLAAGGPIWSELSVSRGGELALVGSTPAHPSELFHRAGAAAAQRLTDSNPWLAQRRLAERQVVRYAARDGLDIEGILLRPLGAAEGERVPLILVAHGGPEAHYSNGWLTDYNDPGQTGAARGFAVFFPNYRASTGRGVAFSKLDHYDPAGKEFDDLVDGVDHLVDIGLVDRERVGITGGSYGGYATAWGATYYSERFAAGVMAVGVSEKIAKYGTSEITQEVYLVHERKYPWDDFQFALERSPVYYVKQAKTPLLILHGKKDTRVFPGQSLTLYRYLKMAGQAPVRLVWYPEEGHGNRRAAARLDFSLRQLRWMEHYLMGPGGEAPPYDVDYGLDADAEETAAAGPAEDTGTRP